ncbi:MAG: hypothetical protein FWF87_05220 [Synergistaceae bacterium]|nr:hypothetical protein [Synergistaceae bacterium]
MFGWEPIGNATTPFTGGFDGAGHKLTMFWIDRSTEDYVGLFGFMRNAVLKNLGLEMDVTNGGTAIDGGGIVGKNYVGGLAGRADNSRIENCFTTGNINSAGSSVGELVGQAAGSDIAGCYSFTGPTIMMLNLGYAATSSSAFTITSNPTVTKSSGNAAITWNNSTKKLDIATGLTAGVYPVVLSVNNGAAPNTTFTFTLTVPAVGTSAPGITGPTDVTITVGYAAASYGPYSVTGVPAPTVVKTSGNDAITWNNSTKKLDVATGLTAGTYNAILTASNSLGSAPLTFTLTVKAAGTTVPGITGPTDVTLKVGYAATSYGPYAITGVPAPTVVKTSGNDAITWNNSTKKLDVAAGLPADTYIALLTASNDVGSTPLTFTLTVNNVPGNGGKSGGGGCNIGYGFLALAFMAILTFVRKAIWNS